jgi:hypothetical protein
MKCAICRREKADKDLYPSPVGWTCQVDVKRLLSWAHMVLTSKTALAKYDFQTMRDAIYSHITWELEGGEQT